MNIRSRLFLATVMLWCSAAVHAEQYTIPLFLAPSAGNDPQGVLRIVNEAAVAGGAEIVAIDDSGAEVGVAILELGASAAVQLSAAELQSGNANKGLNGGIGNFAGEVRLVLYTNVPIVPSAYVRGADGTLSAMNATVLGAAVAGQTAGVAQDTGGEQTVGVEQDAHRYDVTLFHPASNLTQPSRLRLINPGAVETRVTIEGRDDAGNPAPGGPVELTLPPGGARTLSAQQLEAGDSAAFTGRLGASVGNWRLSVSADRPIQVLNMTVSATGEWRNLSTTGISGWAPEDHQAFATRFRQRMIVSRDGQGRVTFQVLWNDRLLHIYMDDGVEIRQESQFAYERIGRDTGLLRLDYGAGASCEARFFFDSRSSGWHAIACVDGDDRVENWTGGDWLSLDAGAAPLDLGPVLDDLIYTAGTAIDALTLPAASGGDDGGELTYSLTPDVPGLSFGPQTRTLTGTPSEAGEYRMTWRVRDAAGDTDWRYFNIRVVRAPGDGQETIFGVGDTLSELPAGVWEPDAISDGSFAATGSSSSVALNDGGYIEEGNYRYTCQSSVGCGIENRRVISGAIVQTARGMAPVGGVADDHSDIRATATEIEAVSNTGGTLHAGDADYFRVVADTSGTLEAYTSGSIDTSGRLEDADGSVLATDDDGGAGTNFRISEDLHAGTYFVRVAGYSSQTMGAYTLHVRFTESDGGTTPPTDTGSDCHVGLQLNPGDSCTYPGADDKFTVTSDGRGRFLFFTSGGSIDLSNSTINGRAYDLAVSHQGGGVWRIDRVEGSTEPPGGGTVAGDRAALMALYNATDGPNWANNANWGSDAPLGRWHGVSTDNSDRVTELDLRDNQLDGAIPGELGSLSNLERLRLSDNELSGAIPSDLGNLSDLITLSLSDNQLSGALPRELGALSSLRYLSLDGNQFSGAIPEELGALSGLLGLVLRDNQLSGEIPGELGNLSNLERLWLNGNELSGAIPAELGDLSNLEYIYLGDNQLSGCIPDALGDVENNDLATLGLSYCGDGGAGRDTQPSFATGSSPADQPYTVGTAIAALTLPSASGGNAPLTYGLSPAVPGLSFDAASRRLTGTPSMAGAYEMTYRVRDADGDTDALTFTITVEASGGPTVTFGIGDTLSELPVGSWRPDVISGGSFAAAGDNTSIALNNGGYIEESGYRYTCQSSGGCAIENRRVTGGAIVQTVSDTVPGGGTGTDDRATLMALYNATDGSNWVNNHNWGSDAPLDSWYGVTTDNSDRVTDLDLSGNQLSGAIPGELGNLSNLETLWLQRNRLSGAIPGELGNLSNLRLLYAPSNELSGTIPAGLGDLSSLELLDLSGNQLSGAIPGELGELFNLEDLDLSGNQLSGAIPGELGNLSNLETLWLQRNRLSGAIPGELGNLSNLRLIYLGGNQLSGCIPDALRDVANNDLSRLGLSYCGTGTGQNAQPSFVTGSGP